MNLKIIFKLEGGKMKKIKVLIIAFLLLFPLTGCVAKKEELAKLHIVSTSFPGYDFARAITKEADDVEVSMLINPGMEVHDFDPAPKDIVKIKESDIFIYVGGDSDEWIEDILEDLDSSQTKVIKLMDLVDMKEEEHVEGMEEHEHEHDEIEYEEHVWTSPMNVISIINKLKEEIKKMDSKNKESYEKNANEYIEKLENIDKDIKDLVQNAKRKELIFGDRFPLLYFVKEYGLSYYAAFPGCSEQTEASPKTISFLVKKVKEDGIPVVFHIELSSGKIAATIAEETGAKVLEFHSAHNISKSDFDKGITYVDIMKKNIEALKQALN